MPLQKRPSFKRPAAAGAQRPGNPSFKRPAAHGTLQNEQKRRKTEEEGHEPQKIEEERHEPRKTGEERHEQRKGEEEQQEQPKIEEGQKEEQEPQKAEEEPTERKAGEEQGRHDAVQEQEQGLDQVPAEPTAVEIVAAAAENIAALCRLLPADDPELRFQATMALRKLLAEERNTPIQEAIDAGAVPHVVQSLKDDRRRDLQFEAAWVLTNIASGSLEQALVVLEQGAAPILAEMLATIPDDAMQEQVVWALGNLAGGIPASRDMVLQTEALPAVLRASQDFSASSIKLVRSYAWAIRNFLHGRPPPPFELVAGALSRLAEFTHSDDVQLLEWTCWGLVHLSAGSGGEQINHLMRSGAVPRLRHLAGHSDERVRKPALVILRNVLAADWERLILGSEEPEKLREELARIKEFFYPGS